MRLKVLTTGLLIGLLVSCSETKQTNTISQLQTPKPTDTPTKSQVSVFDNVSFPQDSCGDKPPDDLEAYPVKFYPVFIDYSESNLQRVRAGFCKDAINKFREKIGKDTIQVASFSSPERANQFKDFLKNKLGSGEVGEPTLIEGKQVPEQTTNSVTPKDLIGKATKLNSIQAQQLISINSKVKELETKAVVVVPTDIPPEFKVDIFKTWYQQHPIPEYTGPRYTIIYRSSSNSCFEFSGGVIQPIGEPPTIYDTISKISSSALGTVSLGYMDSDRKNGSSYIGFTDSMNRVTRGKNEYTFQSPVSHVQSSALNHVPINKCSSISVREAIKVVKSLRSLNP